MKHQLKCCYPSCIVSATELLTTIDNGHHIYTLCPMHLMYFQSEELSKVIPSELQSDATCIMCKTKDKVHSFTTYDKGKIKKILLCNEHIQKLISIHYGNT